MQDMSRLADVGLASQEGVCCMGFVSCAKQNTVLLSLRLEEIF